MAPTPHLNGNFMVFGKVLSGYDVVELASKVKTGPGDQPLEPGVQITACRAVSEEAFQTNTWEQRVYGGAGEKVAAS